ncbi:MAG: hypothetical protein IPH74_02915 [Bacteroidetes bacterium]|nr:hypothetical protein [Bacteroidota bacterium]
MSLVGLTTERAYYIENIEKAPHYKHLQSKPGITSWAW